MGRKHSKNAGVMGSEALTYHERKGLGHGTVTERLGKVRREARMPRGAAQGPRGSAPAGGGLAAAAAAGGPPRRFSADTDCLDRLPFCPAGLHRQLLRLPPYPDTRSGEFRKLAAAPLPEHSEPLLPPRSCCRLLTAYCHAGPCPCLPALHRTLYAPPRATCSAGRPFWRTCWIRKRPTSDAWRPGRRSRQTRAASRWGLGLGRAHRMRVWQHCTGGALEQARRQPRLQSWTPSPSHTQLYCVLPLPGSP
jgi:hypothetical protein